MLVIRNDKSKGRLIRYKVNGVSKSVFLSAFQVKTIDELEDTDHLLNKRDRLVNEIIEKFETNSSLKDFYYKRKGGVTDITRDIGLGLFMIRVEVQGSTGINIFVASPSNILSVGKEVYSDRELTPLSGTKVLLYENGGTSYEITVVEGVITSVDENVDVLYQEFTIIRKEGGRRVDVFIINGNNPYDIGVEFFSDDSGTSARLDDGIYIYEETEFTIENDVVVPSKK